MPATAPLSIRPNPGSRSVAARRDFIPPCRGEMGNLVCGSSSVQQVTRARCEGVKELGKKNTEGKRCKFDRFSMRMSWQHGTAPGCRADFEAPQLFPAAAGSRLTR